MGELGYRRVSGPLGEAFHSRRLALRSSQVGMVSPARRSRRGYADRLALTFGLLEDPAFDALVNGECRFDFLSVARFGFQRQIPWYVAYGTFPGDTL